MQKVKKALALVLAVLGLTTGYAQKKEAGILSDLIALSGSWQGSLTYIDYSSGKPYTMPADIEIRRIGNTNQFAFAHRYPNEPKANSVDTVAVSPDGQFIDGTKVISRTVLENGDIEIVAEEKGKDGNDNKPATFRHILLIGKTRYSKRKEVQFDGERAWLKRHEYSYTRKP